MTRRRFVLRFLTALAAVGVALLIQAADAQAYATDGSPTLHRAHRTVYVDVTQAGSFTVAVEHAVAWWQYGTDVDVRVGACRAGASCARVVAAHRGRHVQPGVTYLVWDGATLEMADPIITKFDLDYGWSAHDKAQAACHEIGRQVGLERTFTYWKGSCMYTTLDGAAATTPSDSDRTVINRVY